MAGAYSDQEAKYVDNRSNRSHAHAKEYQVLLGIINLVVHAIRLINYPSEGKSPKPYDANQNVGTTLVTTSSLFDFCYDDWRKCNLHKHR
mmetsp:Transcript_123235/g.224036  ORF Transcript_123235/g.224036 Transcript_123235/m.224036 type:complete len:90 (+) Transcript_123235:506-775(+)